MQATGGKLMVVDLQGMIINGATSAARTIELTDPAIHCTELLRYGRTNLSEKGMAGFFSRHQCTQVCKKMGLIDLTKLVKFSSPHLEEEEQAKEDEEVEEEIAHNDVEKLLRQLRCWKIICGCSVVLVVLYFVSTHFWPF